MKKGLSIAIHLFFFRVRCDSGNAWDSSGFASVVFTLTPTLTYTLTLVDRQTVLRSSMHSQRMAVLPMHKRWTHKHTVNAMHNHLHPAMLLGTLKV